MASRKPSTAAGKPNLLLKAVRFARSQGIRLTLYRAVKRLIGLCRLQKRLGLCVVDLFAAGVSELKSHGRIPRAFQVRPAREEEWPELGPYFENPQRVRDRLQRGAVCTITVAGQQVCAGLWLSFGPCQHAEDRADVGCVFQFPEGVAWSFDGKGTRWGAWGALMARLPEYLEERGVGEMFLMIECDNRESIDGHRSSGFRRVGRVFFLKIFRPWLCLWKPEGGSWRRLPGQIGKLRFSRDVDENFVATPRGETEQELIASCSE